MSTITAGATASRRRHSLTDAKSPFSVCPLMSNKIQLLPLRYGMVERLDPRDSLSMPYALESRPLGIRLLRDGWLYVIVDQQPQAVLHEYRIEDGVVSQKLWQEGPVTADVRDASVGEPSLIYSRTCTLYVAYAEIQWSAGKCAQVLDNSTEREHFMHPVSLLEVDAMNGAQDLLAPYQAEQWIAEVVEQPSLGSAAAEVNPEENTDYLWEAHPQFKRAELSKLQLQLTPEYVHDHAYLIIPDDLGVLRDLAEHQDLVIGWISDWSEDETAQHKYVMGCYIESLYTVTSARVGGAAQADPKFAQLYEDTNEDQRQLITEYVNATHQTQWQGPGSRKDAINAARESLRQTMGDKYPVYKDLIDSINTETKAALHGEFWKFGQDGVHDLIDRPAMEAFLKQQRAQLQRWNQRLDRITSDRIKLISEERFYRSAWYFDVAVQGQMEAALATEYACLKDICRTDEAVDAIAKLLEKTPGLSLPGFYTQSLASQNTNNAKMIMVAKYGRDLFMSRSDLSGTKPLNGYFSDQMGTSLAGHLHLSEDGVVLDRLRNTAYEPAKQLLLAGAMDDAMQGLRTGQPVDPSILLRAIPNAAWLDMLRTFDKEGLTLTMASPVQIKMFQADMDELIQKRKQLTVLKHQIKQTLSMERHGSLRRGSHRALVQKRKTLQKTIEPLEQRIAHGMSPIGEEGGKVSFMIRGLHPQHVAEFQRMADDFRLKRPYGGLLKTVYKSAGGDLFALALAVFQIVVAYDVFGQYLKKDVIEAEDRAAITIAISSALGALFSASQGIAITSLSVAIDKYTSAAGKVMKAARLGKITGVLGPVAYLSGTVAALASIFGSKGSGAKWLEGVRSGDARLVAGASLSLAGDSGQLGLNGWAAVRSGQAVYGALSSVVGARTLAWATTGLKLINICVRANLIGLAITVLQLAGEWIYNKYNKSELDKFLLQSIWGQESAGQSLTYNRRLLADLTTKPQFAFGLFNSKPMAVLSLPGLSASELDDIGIGLSAYWMTDPRYNDWDHWTEGLAYQLRVLSEPDAPLALGFEIYPNELNASHGLAIKLRYPQMVDKVIYRERYFETTSLNITSFNVINEVSMLRVRVMDAPWIIITHDVLASAAECQYKGILS
jgi:hypothetical protein